MGSLRWDTPWTEDSGPDVNIFQIVLCNLTDSNYNIYMFLFENPFENVDSATGESFVKYLK